ncbi:MAG TPA: GntR family transcriptional regulator [Microlunatus sp.]|nr:GntR family transcriptional regulator [Microlunatus sp.]
MHIAKIEQSSLADQVAEQLRRMIVLGRLAPGEHLAETALAERFGVSRGPLREALSRLVAEGLVTVVNKRVRVRTFGADEVRDLFRLRGALELLAVDELVERRHGADLAEAERAAAELARAADTGSGYAVADLAFHDALCAASGNHRLVRFWQQLRPTLELLVAVTGDAGAAPDRDPHSGLLDRIRAGDAAGVKADLDRHLRDTLDRLVRTELPSRATQF